VDKAEQDSHNAFAINADAPVVLAEEARYVGALLLHYSSDYVFDGKSDVPYREGDATCPLSIYGHSKLAGEQAIAASGARSIVLRTSWVAGVHGNNFIKKVLQLAREKAQFPVIADQFGAPTTAALVADVTAHMIRRLLCRAEGEEEALGLYHVAAAGEVSWHGYAVEIVQYALANGWQLKAAPYGIEPITSAQFNTLARRPANSRLNTSRLQEVFRLHLPEWRVGVHHLLDQLHLGERNFGNGGTSASPQVG